MVSGLEHYERRALDLFVASSQLRKADPPPEPDASEDCHVLHCGSGVPHYAQGLSGGSLIVYGDKHIEVGCPYGPPPQPRTVQNECTESAAGLGPGTAH